MGEQPFETARARLGYERPECASEGLPAEQCGARDTDDEGGGDALFDDENHPGPVVGSPKNFGCAAGKKSRLLHQEKEEQRGPIQRPAKDARYRG